MASSSSITPSSVRKYDAFLNFRVEDTHPTFTSHLFNVLSEKNISTFTDDNLRRREEISSDLLRAIKESRISVIIFSKNYASSSWCLDELVEIVKCRGKYNQIVIPVYYDIDPSEVRHQTGPFAEAFKNHEARLDITSVDSVQKWRSALVQAANLSGFYKLPDFKSEAELTQKIVDEILKKLDKEAIHEPKPSGSNIGGSDSSYEDEEADDNEDTGEQNRGGGGEEAIHDPKITAGWFQRITAEKKFVAICFILELPSVVFEKLSSVHKPQYLLVSMVMSFLTMLICIIHHFHQGRKRRVGWKRKGKILWLYYTPRSDSTETPSDKPFGSVTDFIGLLCVILQSIFTAIDYALHLRNINDPIAVSIWPVIFSFCAMFSTFFKEFPKEETSTKCTCSLRASAVLGANIV